MKIYLIKRIEMNFRLIKEYITSERGKRVAEIFEQKAIDFLAISEEFPEIGIVEVIEKQIRGFQLTGKQESVTE